MAKHNIKSTCQSSQTVSIVFILVCQQNPREIVSSFTAFSSKGKEWLVQSQDNVFELRDMYICRLLFHRASTVKLY